MTAQIIEFRKPKQKAVCSFCQFTYEDFKGIISSTGAAICKSCGKEAAKRIKEEDVS